MVHHGQDATEKRTHPSQEETIAGVLYESINVPNPMSLVVIGPYCSVKGQAPKQYATKMAEEGYFRDPERDVAKPYTKARMERAKEARELYGKKGELVYHRLVDSRAADSSVGSLAGLPGPLTGSRYSPYTPKGFENRYAVPDIVDRNMDDIAA
ncbi:hypothetical protein HRG_007071 [Hirsutella rhossiliensis]|uniref:Uncharacterized protein n=1 Tax=Hirsutella rhossiliensis TaxID=111463 RepID=A0A9P8MXC0_9HYPO|nr:uncharacterized protein HRG_07071 [Hirsutella rhossiliensis]KAH0961991.1 hypothetical protein HRG_07071 [Hirsutella rhossiliensis]